MMMEVIKTGLDAYKPIPIRSLPVALPPAITDTLKATLADNVAVGGLVVSLNTAATPVPSPSFGGEATLSMFMVAAGKFKRMQKDHTSIPTHRLHFSQKLTVIVPKVNSNCW